jgi:hypothetical protein
LQSSGAMGSKSYSPTRQGQGRNLRVSYKASYMTSFFWPVSKNL